MDIKGPIADHAIYPEYAIEANRLVSFEDWPMQIKQKAKELADAGFFYTGSCDRVRCFCCGGLLWQWEETDIVWEQHAFYYDKCEYMLLIKGDQYHDSVIEKFARARIEKNRTNDESTSEIHSPDSNSSEGCDQSPMEKSNECKICLIEEFNTVFIPCGHVVACGKCASTLRNCPICRKEIGNILRIYF